MDGDTGEPIALDHRGDLALLDRVQDDGRLPVGRLPLYAIAWGLRRVVLCHRYLLCCGPYRTLCPVQRQRGTHHGSTTAARLSDKYARTTTTALEVTAGTTIVDYDHDLVVRSLRALFGQTSETIHQHIEQGQTGFDSRYRAEHHADDKEHLLGVCVNSDDHINVELRLDITNGLITRADLHLHVMGVYWPELSRTDRNQVYIVHTTLSSSNIAGSEVVVEKVYPPDESVGLPGWEYWKRHLIAGDHAVLRCITGQDFQRLYPDLFNEAIANDTWFTRTATMSKVAREGHPLDLSSLAVKVPSHLYDFLVRLFDAVDSDDRKALRSMSDDQVTESDWASIYEARLAAPETVRIFVPSTASGSSPFRGDTGFAGIPIEQLNNSGNRVIRLRSLGLWLKQSPDGSWKLHQLVHNTRIEMGDVDYSGSPYDRDLSAKRSWASGDR